jgi:predicted MFS family arabinose efflux permease
MTSRELRASVSLASIFGLRLFGMFVILPVFALYARDLPGWSLTLVGVALGIYGLTQAVLQIPFGWLSDRYGRKPVLYAGLAMFAAGSLICAVSTSPIAMILGRALQGAGAISGVVIAMAADLTRDSQRGKAMAIIGSTIGVSFAVSFAISPFLSAAIGVPGIFAMTAGLAAAAIGVVAFVVPDVEEHESPRVAVPFREVLANRELQRLDVGIFVLHVVLMALFIVVPVALKQTGVAPASHAWVYLGAVVAGFLFAMPAIIGRAAHVYERGFFLGAIALLAASIVALVFGLAELTGIGVALVIFFTAFNVLEARLPSLVARHAPAGAKGAATGVYSSVQFLGTFVGGALGGAIAQHAGFSAVLVFCLVLALAWMAVAWQMAPSAIEQSGVEASGKLPASH